MNRTATLALVWIAPLAAAVAALMGGLTLLGWCFGVPVLTRILPDGHPMSVGTAWSMVLLSAALIAAARVGFGRSRSAATRWFCRAAASGAAALAAIHAYRTLHHGIAAPGTGMSPGGIIAVPMLALALWLASARSFLGAFQIPGAAAAIIGWFGLTSYLYGGQPLLPGAMAIHTSLGLIFLAFGVVTARADGGLIPLLANPSLPGKWLRRLLLPSLVLPVFLGWLRLRGQQAGWYGTEAGLALFALSNVVVFGGLVWWVARALARSEGGRQAVVDALGKSEQRLEAVIEKIGEGLVVSDLNGQVLHWNRAALAMHDFKSREECLRHLSEFQDIFELSDLDGQILAIEEWPLPRLFRGETLHNFVVRIRRKDRDWERIVSYGGSVAQEPSGRPIAFVTIRDVTERHHAETALLESEERYRRMIEEARDAVFVLAADRTIRSLNPAFEQITGFSRDEWVGRSFVPLLHPDDLKPAAERFQRALSGEKLPPFEVRILRRAGDYANVEMVASVQRVHQQVVGLMGFGRDVTERRRLETQFHEAQKMESIGTLAGGIAHDFNNILAAITGFTELAKRGVPDERTRGYLSAVAEASARATDLVRQILAFSRHQKPKREPLELGPVVAETLKLLRATLPSTLAFDVDLPSSAAVLADATQVHQVVMNLCTNASHAMRDRAGRLTVKLAMPDLGAGAASLDPNLKPGRYVRLEVGDTGTGMDEATLSRIFEPFFTTKPPGEGTGLGLSVVHGIMRNHDGAITVTSEPGLGTTFHLYFPVHEGRAAPAASPAAAAKRGQGEHVLLVDDEDLLTQMGEIMLTDLGYRATIASGPEAALEQIRCDPSIALVMTDLTMPGMTGLDLARAIHELRPRLPIILISGYVSRLTPEQLREAEISTVLTKPQTFEALASALRQALDPRPSP